MKLTNAWTFRAMPAELRQRYLRDGWWDESTLGELLLEWLAAEPELSFNVWSTRQSSSIRFGEMRDRVLRLASGLRRQGVGRGDAICVYLPNSVDAAVSAMAVIVAGAIVVPIAPFYGLLELKYILGRSAARMLITTEAPVGGRLDAIQEMRADFPALIDVRVIGETVPPGMNSYEALFDPMPPAVISKADPDDVVIIGFTSGTTASPKGVVHCHRSLCSELRHHLDRLPWPSGAQLVGGPIAHFTGMLCGMFLPMFKRRSVHLIDGWDAGLVLDVMRRHKVGTGTGTPFFLTSIMNHPQFVPEDVRNVGAVFLGAATVPASFAEGLGAMGVVAARTYGSTEQPTIFGGMPTDPADKRHRTDGALLAGVEVKLLDELGNEVPVGAEGEVVCRGPDLCAGYIDEEMNRTQFDDEGWFRTGDVAVRDADGFYTITDRIKDVIIRNGVKIGASEVEQVLLRFPGLIECAVVAAPDERTGERGHAFLRLKPGAEAPSLENLRVLLEQSGLARQKWPEDIEVVENFPRTPAGKVKKAELRDELRRRHAERTAVKTA
jgi:acyl-CoA synthetase (AMP-forming)/AMP-acid ligase II